MTTTGSPLTAKNAWYGFVLDGIEASEITYADDVSAFRSRRGVCRT